MTDYRSPIHQESMFTDSLCDPDLQALHLYRESLRRSGAIPLRSDFDPMKVASLLESIVLFNVDSANRYTVRIVGEAVRQVVGENTTGKPAGSIMNDAAALVAVLDAVATERAPKFRVGALYWRDEAKCPRKFELCFLPLSRQGPEVDMILAAIKFQPLRA